MKWKETEDKMGKSWFVKQRGDRTENETLQDLLVLF